MTLILEDEAEPVSTGFKLRGEQPKWVEQIETDFQAYHRLLAVGPGGVGKSSVMGVLADRLWRRRGKRTIVLENRDRLTEQTADRIREETGLDVDVEKAQQHASPFAPIVVGSVQTLSRIGRLSGFADDHFGMVVADECHFSLSESWQKILKYFHYGAHSLDEKWVKPEEGLYVPRAKVVGFTASPHLSGRQQLGGFYQHQSVDYSYLTAIQDGWLVGIEEHNIPVKIDTRKFRIKRTQEGQDFNATDQSAAIIPIIGELAAQLVLLGSDKKGICFLPSVECCRLMADELNRRGLTAIFVSGECIDKNDKTDRFAASGPGTWLINCALYVYGIDFVDVDAIAPFSAVISKVNYIQKIYRGTRVLKGVVHDWMTAEQRRAAIAASAKPKLTVISPFFISDRIDICELYDIFTDTPEVKKRMKEIPELGFEAAAEKAQRDYIKSMEKEAKRHANKVARVIDPVKWSVSLGEASLASYVPKEPWESLPIRKDQAVLLTNLNMDPEKYGIAIQGLADKIIGILLLRKDLKLAQPGQLEFLRKLTKKDEAGNSIPMFDEAGLSTMKAGQAGAIIGKVTQGWANR